jgi:hypothetical protein
MMFWGCRNLRSKMKVLHLFSAAFAFFAVKGSEFNAESAEDVIGGWPRTTRKRSISSSSPLASASRSSRSPR